MCESLKIKAQNLRLPVKIVQYTCALNYVLMLHFLADEGGGSSFPEPSADTVGAYWRPGYTS